MNLLMALISGSVFGFGLVLSGMTDTNKVIGFLDVQQWDYDLMFVMVGAIAVMFVTYRWVVTHSAPVYAESFSIPTHTVIDKKLVVGSLLFGIGWALYGLCPGPSVISLLYQHTSLAVFFVSMLVGFFVVDRVK
ncbi:MAG: DUF6691 family protein [Pseudomonadota bacterium]